MILSVCDVPDVLKVMKLVKLVILLIKIIVPIALIVSVMIDFMKAVTTAEDFSKTGNLLVKKIIAAVVLFLLPTAVNIIVNLVDPGNEYMQCFNMATTESINAKYEAHMQNLINYLKSYPSSATHSEAVLYLSNITNTDLKNKFKAELDEFKKIIDEKEKNPPKIIPRGKGGSLADEDFLKTAENVWKEIVLGDRYFTYGNANQIPPTGSKIDCSAYVSWVIYEYGYKDFAGWQHVTKTLYETDFHEKYGWEELYFPAGADIFDDVKPGDIVVRDPGNNYGHTNIIVERQGNYYLSYDCGNSDNMKHGANPNGVYAYNFLKHDSRRAKIIRVIKHD